MRLWLDRRATAVDADDFKNLSRRKHWKLYDGPRTEIPAWRKEFTMRTLWGRDRVLGEFNASTLDSVGQVGGQDQQMRVLGEMNELEQTIREGMPKVNLL